MLLPGKSITAVMLTVAHCLLSYFSLSDPAASSWWLNVACCFLLIWGFSYLQIAPITLERMAFPQLPPALICASRQGCVEEWIG